MQVVTACTEDVDSFLVLAAQVEHLFGPMLDDPAFHRVLHKNVARGSAFCVREQDGPPGSPLMGGLLFSAHPPMYTLGWLVVDRNSRRHGVGRLLAEHALGLAQPPAHIQVTTFTAAEAEGLPARRFYEQLGFRPCELTTFQGQPRQVYRKDLN